MWLEALRGIGVMAMVHTELSRGWIRSWHPGAGSGTTSHGRKRTPCPPWCSCRRGTPLKFIRTRSDGDELACSENRGWYQPRGEAEGKRACSGRGERDTPRGCDAEDSAKPPTAVYTRTSPGVTTNALAIYDLDEQRLQRLEATRPSRVVLGYPRRVNWPASDAAPTSVVM